MSINEFLSSHVQPAPGAMLPLGTLVKAYKQAGGKESRTKIVVALTSQGYSLREWYQAATVIDGVSLKS